MQWAASLDESLRPFPIAASAVLTLCRNFMFCLLYVNFRPEQKRQMQCRRSYPIILPISPFSTYILQSRNSFTWLRASFPGYRLGSLIETTLPCSRASRASKINKITNSVAITFKLQNLYMNRWHSVLVPIVSDRRRFRDWFEDVSMSTCSPYTVQYSLSHTYLYLPSRSDRFHRCRNLIRAQYAAEQWSYEQFVAI